MERVYGCLFRINYKSLQLNFKHFNFLCRRYQWGICNHILNTHEWKRRLCSKCSIQVVAPVCSHVISPLVHPHSGFHTNVVLPSSARTSARNTKKKRVISVIRGKRKSTRPVVEVFRNMTVEELAEILEKDVDDIFEVFEDFENTDIYESPSSKIGDISVIKEVVRRCGFQCKERAAIKVVKPRASKDAVRRLPATSDMLKNRPPVVTIMGHVDHGKTTLLDALRKTNVVAQEFGGITQHIGAFSVMLSSGNRITFLDTPGHAAFSAMRARGAQVTDIVILVVAADDGVMKQTVESISHAQRADVPIVVAVNKIDKPKANPEATKELLLQYGVELEEAGGDVQVVPISALKGTNLDDLQEAVITQAELMELQADPTGLVEATVIESRTDTGRGKVCTALIQRGEIKKGAFLVAGNTWAKVRGLFDNTGRTVKSAMPGMPVEIIGWRDTPSAGDEILEVESESRAREVISWRLDEEKERKASEDHVIIAAKQEKHKEEYAKAVNELLDRGYRFTTIYRRQRTKELDEGPEGPQLSIVIKGDVDGSVEAILNVLETYESDKCQLNLLNYGVGPVTELDVEMAASFSGVVYAFNVGCPEKVYTFASKKNVIIQHHNIIYKLFDDIRERLSEKLLPEKIEVTMGEANVVKDFTISQGKKKINVAGCRCVSGMLHKKKLFKLIRNGELIMQGNLSSLKHMKNEVESIKKDVECGLSFENQTEVPTPGDKIICYETQELEGVLDWEMEF